MKETPTMPEPTDPPHEVVNLTGDEVPEAVALVSLIRGLHVARNGVPGVDPAALIRAGARIVGEFHPRDHVEWALVTARAAEFWSVASTFDPRLAAHELTARRALKAARVTVGGGRRR
jgi:hypothetical protein